MLISGPSGLGMSLMSPSEAENKVVDRRSIWTRILKPMDQLKENRWTQIKTYMVDISQTLRIAVVSCTSASPSCYTTLKS